MLEIKIDGHANDGKGMLRIKTNGTQKELAADILVIIQELYGMIKKESDKNFADDFLLKISENLIYCRNPELLNKAKTKKNEFEDLHELVHELKELRKLLEEDEKDEE